MRNLRTLLAIAPIFVLGCLRTDFPSGCEQDETQCEGATEGSSSTDSDLVDSAPADGGTDSTLEETAADSNTDEGTEGGDTSPTDTSSETLADSATEAASDSAIPDTTTDTGSPTDTGVDTAPVCAASSYQCSGDQLRQCKPDGTGFNLITTCPTGTCSAAAGRCTYCTPGTLACSSTQPTKCNTLGTAYDANGAACVSPQTCGGGGTVGVCGCTPLTACTGGRICGTMPDGCGGTITCGPAARCTGKDREVCAGDQKSYVLDKTCAVSCDVAGCIEATQLDVGANFACARLSNGTIRCWGANDFCRISSATTTNYLVPTAISGITTASAVAAGYEQICSLNADGTASCWGSNTYGGVGTDKLPGDNTCSPARVVGLSGASVLDGGSGHMCAISGSKVFCWGRDEAGQASGDGLTTSLFSATESKVSAGAAEIGLSGLFTCTRASGGLVSCFGRNGSGQLGNGSTLDKETPVSTGLVATQIWPGPTSVCARGASGVYCWGDDGSGKLADGLTSSKSSPTLISQLATALEWRTGGSHGCGRFSDGSVKCVGDNTYLQLGPSASGSSLTLMPVYAVTNVDAIRAGDSFTCVLVRGTVRCWGRNDRGQLGDGTTTNHDAPIEVKW